MPYNIHMTELKTEKISKLFSNKTEYSILYTVQYTVHCTVYCTVYTVQYTVHCTVYCTLYSILYTVQYCKIHDFVLCFINKRKTRYINVVSTHIHYTVYPQYHKHLYIRGIIYCTLFYLSLLKYTKKLF